MKILGCFVFLFYSQLILCQVVYTSPITQHFPTSELERINRTISINEEPVILESETLVKTKAIQTFYINEYSRQEFPDYGLSDFIVCSTKDGLIITYFIIPITDKIEYMDVIRPRRLNQEARHNRFLLD